ncbi:MAG: phospholipase [Muribaculaceae bacterium]|nr:phospholipase [Muribaculaceae bacterium]
MTVIAILAGVLVVAGVILWTHDRLTRPRRIARGEPEVVEPEQQCCGMHLTCEKDSLSTVLSDGTIDYFDDEELDAMAGRAPESYTAEEAEAFREVLLTLIPGDIAPWARSLQLRGIELPPEVKEELLMIVAEARAQAAPAMNER